MTFKRLSLYSIAIAIIAIAIVFACLAQLIAYEDAHAAQPIVLPIGGCIELTQKLALESPTHEATVECEEELTEQEEQEIQADPSSPGVEPETPFDSEEPNIQPSTQPSTQSSTQPSPSTPPSSQETKSLKPLTPVYPSDILTEHNQIDCKQTRERHPPIHPIHRPTEHSTYRFTRVKKGGRHCVNASQPQHAQQHVCSCKAHRSPPHHVA